MFTPDDFLKYAQWMGIGTIFLAVITILGFILKWGIRFRLVGTTGFMLVLTAGLFSLSLAPITRTVIPGATRYNLVYDNGSNQAVITVPLTITNSQLDATLRQAASNLYSYGRSGIGGDNQLTIRARVVLHPEPGVSVPLYIGQVKRSLLTREDENMSVEIFTDKLAQLTQASIGS
ncbi:Ycf51 family protein [Calothrix sp. NIES-3974]|uniref:Ycf51 family protein n=1 Tax=Calothrix sp. NIES-3974 TaxID=2005462 RepID=UPI000B610035|nr:Ycf51 family protein [Calothrix sp. NIES-3974]BAZ05468.1 hypothetical protein NIES3974_21160 [Calothrix sp. NIES-3974]